MRGIFFNQGHVCCAGSRLLVQETVADEVVRRLQRRLSTLRVGDPLDKNTDVGAINSRAQPRPDHLARRRRRSRGAERWDNGCALPQKGFWFRPTLFSGVTQTHRIAQEEIFGPVLSVLTFRTRRRRWPRRTTRPTACRRASGPTRVSRILWMADQLKAGVVWANTFNQFDRRRPSAATRSPVTAAKVATRPRGLPGREHLMAARVDVRKTYKLYIGGKFPARSRAVPTRCMQAPTRAGASPKFLANASQGSRRTRVTR